MRKILVTAGLPYANGSIHLGHLLEYVQADIWVRWQKLVGNDCLYICGDDAHGTPIMLSAQQQHITPEELIAKTYLEHAQDFADFYVEFDNFYTTHSEENHELTKQIYQKLVANDDIEIRTIYQAYDSVKEMFLPDRFIRGNCPKCNTADQYGDNCENCGATYSPLDLKNPISVLSKTPPIQKSSQHLFFRLAKYTDMLQSWLPGHVSKEIFNKLKEWLQTGLKSWDISRDAPYFGFPIPDVKDQYFYVWLDAPIGYLASHKNLCSRNPSLEFDSYWQENSSTELYHFIGKDIVYFHSLFWPAILTSAKLRKPTAVFVHGYLTINGQKLSKSRGLFIRARDYLKYLNPEYLRYYYATKLNGGINDIDLNLDDFRARVNSDLVGKVINIASRCANFINNYFEGKLAETLADQNLFNQAISLKSKIQQLFEKGEYSQATREIIGLADLTNQYIDEQKPWVIAKQNPHDKRIQNICTIGLNMFRNLMIYLQPILPKTAQNVCQFLNIKTLRWIDLAMPLCNHQINPFTPLITRIDQLQINQLLQQNDRLSDD